MATAFYAQAKAKRILEIASGDTSDDTLLDELGTAADQHMDNILKIHDERIPLAGTLLNDGITAANFYVAYLYKAKRGDDESAKFFRGVFEELITGMMEKLSIDGQPYIVERFNSRFITGQEDIFALW